MNVCRLYPLGLDEQAQSRIDLADLVQRVGKKGAAGDAPNHSSAAVGKLDRLAPRADCLRYVAQYELNVASIEHGPGRQHPNPPL